MAQQGSLSGQTLQKCPNCEWDQIAFRSRCAKKSELSKAVHQPRTTGMARRAPIGESMDRATVKNRVVHGSGPGERVAADGGSEEEKMAAVEKEEAMEKARDAMMTEIEIATMIATETETETHTGALATNDNSSTMCFSHWKPPGASKRMWSVYLHQQNVF